MFHLFLSFAVLLSQMLQSYVTWATSQQHFIYLSQEFLFLEDFGAAGLLQLSVAYCNSL